MKSGKSIPIFIRPSVWTSGKSKKVFPLSAIAVAAFAFFVFLFPARAADIENVFQSVEPPRPVPPLVFEDENKTQRALADYRGKFVLLNVWATWCPPCAEEMPSLDALQAHFDTRRLVVIPLSENAGDGIVEAFYRGRNIKHLPVAIDAAQRAMPAFSLRGLPATLLIDPQGNEVARVEGNVNWGSQKTLLFIHHKMGDN